MGLLDFHRHHLGVGNWVVAQSFMAKQLLHITDVRSLRPACALRTFGATCAARPAC